MASGTTRFLVHGVADSSSEGAAPRSISASLSCGGDTQMRALALVESGGKKYRSEFRRTVTSRKQLASDVASPPSRSVSLAVHPARVLAVII